MKNIYEQIEELSLPLIKSFSTDLTIHDKKTLNEYRGDFIHITRTSGTALIKLKKYRCTEERDGMQYLLNHYLNDCSHSLILLCIDGMIKKITPDQAIKKSQIYFDRKIENININIEEKASPNKFIKYVVETNTSSFNEAKKEFLKFFVKGRTVKAYTDSGMTFI